MFLEQVNQRLARGGARLLARGDRLIQLALRIHAASKSRRSKNASTARAVSTAAQRTKNQARTGSGSRGSVADCEFFRGRFGL